MKKIIFFWVALTALIVALALYGQGVYVPGDKSPVAVKLVASNPSATSKCEYSVVHLNYTTGHIWGCVGTPPATPVWTDLTASSGGGGGGAAITTLRRVTAATDTATSNDGAIVCSAASNSVVETTPPTPTQYQVLFVKRVDSTPANTCSIAANTGQNIEGNPTLNVPTGTAYELHWEQATNTWWIF